MQFKGLSAYTREFFESLIPNAFSHGFGRYLALLRIDRFGVEGWGTPEEIDRLEAEMRHQLFPLNYPLPGR